MLLIEDYIARDNPAAVEFINRLRDACLGLEELPDRYPHRPELFGDDPCRVMVVSDYLVIYDVGEDEAVILRVVNGYVDLQGFRQG